MTAIYRFARGLRPTEVRSGNQTFQRASEPVKSVRIEAGIRRKRTQGRQADRSAAFGPSDGRALAQALIVMLRSGLVPELLPQPESVNMFFVHVPGRKP